MTDHETSELEYPVNRGRLEMLFDGIFAIAMTILVLELKVPEGIVDRHSVHELAAALAHSIATFGSYLVSFGMLGVLWYRHNLSYRHVRRVTRGMLALHLVQLAAAAFFPFCAALLGRFPGNTLPLVFYAGCVAVYLWAAFATWVLAHRSGALAPDLDPAVYARIHARTLRGATILTAFVAFALARVLLA